MTPTGFLLINKPPGPTSHDVVDMVRRVVKPPQTPPSQGGDTGVSPIRRGSKRGSQLRIGHAGTLDPFASGLLIVGVGRDATRRLDSFKALPKTYLTTLRLGAASDTDDRTGHIEETRIKNLELSLEKIEKILNSFIGEIDQVPPMYSAKKINGQKLYELARQGHTVERKPVKVTIYSIELKNAQTDELTNRQTVKLNITCSTGTYIRALARDIGEKLQCGAYCDALTRTAIGPFALQDALPLDKLNTDNWQSLLQSFTYLVSRITHYESQPKYLIPTTKYETRVLVFGTFDLLHPGHLDFFRQAKELGDHLIAGIGRDQVVAALKGKLPRQNEHARLAAVQECGLVDEAHLLPDNPEERFQWIKKTNPTVIALGYDQTAFTDHLAQDLAHHGINCRIARLKPFHPERYKSSKM
ncbi:MAG: tRNA pseudouridine(55) synthase TruB [Patescibacteria group bacterium]